LIMTWCPDKGAVNKGRVPHRAAVHDGIPDLPTLDCGQVVLLEEPPVHLIGRRAESLNPAAVGTPGAG